MTKVRGIILGGILGVNVFAGCVTHQEIAKSQKPKTVLNAKVSSERALVLSEHFLEWQKGYNVTVRDHARGLAVTDWANDGPRDRHRVTLRTTDDISGSLVSTHIEAQTLDNYDWIDIPSDGGLEAELLNELESYLNKSSTAQTRVK